jgi:hypothetical protein
MVVIALQVVGGAVALFMLVALLDMMSQPNRPTFRQSLAEAEERMYAQHPVLIEKVWSDGATERRIRRRVAAGYRLVSNTRSTLGYNVLTFERSGQDGGHLGLRATEAAQNGSSGG